MILGRTCSVISCIGMLFSTGFWGFALSFVFSALGSNMNSGSEEALIYDSMKEEGKQAEYLKVNSRLNMIIEAAQTIAVVAGGIMAEYSYTLCYAMAVVIAVISLIPAIFFQEPVLKAEKTGVRQHFTESFRILKENKKVRNILLYYEMIFTFYAVVFFYGQKYFSDLGMNKIQISLIMLVSGLASCAGAAACGKMVELFGSKTKYIASIIMAVCTVGLGAGRLTAAILLFSLNSFANSVLYPIQSDTLNSLLPSKQRATIISVGSMLFSVMMICVFPLTGMIAEQIGLMKAFVIVGMLQIAIMGILFHILPHTKK